MKSKDELENDFHWWITSIPDRIDKLQEVLPEEIYCQLDYSLQSLDVLGKYLVGNETIPSLQANKELWDCLASYIGVVYEKVIPTAQWYVELEDDKNIYYGVPSLKTKAKTNFVPHFELTTMLDRKRQDFLSAITRRHIQLQASSS